MAAGAVATMMAACGAVAPKQVIVPPIEPAAADAPRELQAAIVVGIESYPDLSVPADYAEKDADLMARVLLESMGVPKEDVTVLKGSKASRNRIVASTRSACVKLGTQGTMWFFFSGHGMALRSGRHLLVGRNAAREEDGLVSESLDRAELMEMLQGCGRRAIVILDACFSGLTRKGDPIIPGVKMIAEADDLGPPRSDQCGPEPSHTALWTAGGADEFAHSWPEKEHGRFTMLAAGALAGWARSDDGTLELRDAHRHLLHWADVLSDEPSRRQMPQLTCVDTDWVLATGLKVPAATPDFGPSAEELSRCRADLARRLGEVQRLVGLPELEPDQRLAAIDVFRAHLQKVPSACTREYVATADDIEGKVIEAYGGSASSWDARVALGEGVVVSTLDAHETQALRSTVEFDASFARRVWVLWPEIVVGVSLEGDQRVILGAGLRAKVSWFFARSDFQELVHPAVAPGELFGVGIDVPVASRWRLSAEMDVTWWFTASSVVPIQWRLGAAYVF